MNGFDKLFKPKYINDPNDVVNHNSNDYTYHERNWTQWTKYNPFWQDNDHEELGIIIIIIIIAIITIIIIIIITIIITIIIIRFILLY